MHNDKNLVLPNECDKLSYNRIVYACFIKHCSRT